MSAISRCLVHHDFGLGSVADVAGGDDMGVTQAGVTRSIAGNGLIVPVGKNRARWGEPQGTMGVLVGPAATNLVSEDNLDAWTKADTPVVTASVGDPAGGTTAYTVADDDDEDQEYISLETTFTGDAVKSLVFVIRENTMPASGTHILQLRQTSETAGDRLRFNITGWTGGVPQITAETGVHLATIPLADGWYAVLGQTTAVTAAETHSLYLAPTSAAATTGSIDVYRVNAFNAPYPPDLGILDASGTKAVDLLQRDIPAGLTPGMGYSVYVRFRNYMLGNVGLHGHVFCLGDSAAAGSSLELRARDATSNAWVLNGRSTTDAATGAALTNAAAPEADAVYEFVVSVPAAVGDDITVLCSKDGGAVTTDTVTNFTWDSSFDTDKLTLGARGDGTLQGTLVASSLKVLPGTDWTIATAGAVL